MRFNSVKEKSKTVYNHEGGKAYKASNRYQELYLATATQMVLTEKFYGNKNDQHERWISLVREMAKRDPEYVLRLAAYTRNEMKLRTAPIVLLVETVLENIDPNTHQLDTETREAIVKFAPHIIKRADEMAEIIAYYISIKGQIGTDTKGKNGLPNVLKTVIKKELASDKFSDYNIIKNDKNNATVSFRDLLRIVHPKPSDKKTAEFYRKVVKRESFDMIAQETWEGIISQGGSNKETWSKAAAVMPIFATVRNIRNLFDNDVDFKVIRDEVISKLTNRDQVMKSRLLPFRFYQAYKEVKERNFETSAALEQAILTSTMDNVPKFEGITACFVDVSGSMHSKASDKSTMEMMEIGALFGAVIMKKNGRNNTILCGYDSTIHPIKANENDSIFHIMSKILQNNGGATYAYLCVEFLLQNHVKVDRMIFFSDMQSYSSSSAGYSLGAGSISYSGMGRYSPPRQYAHSTSLEMLIEIYRKEVNPDVKVYDINLQDYGTIDVNPNRPNVVIMGGWSERVFDLINITEEGEKGKNIKEHLASLYP